MSSIELNLALGEQIVFKTKKFMSGKALATFVVIGVVTVVVYVGVFLLLAALIAWLDWKTSDFIVTNRRVLVRAGVLTRKSFELKLEQVESVQVDEPFGAAGRFGNVTIVGTGGSTERLQRIADPRGLRRAILEGTSGEPAATNRTT